MTPKVPKHSFFTPLMVDTSALLDMLEPGRMVVYPDESKDIGAAQ